MTAADETAGIGDGDEDDDEGWIPLSREFAAKDGAPRIARVDPRIFVVSYFERCMTCSFCEDRCCAGGVGVDLPHAARILMHARELAAYSVGKPEQWFDEEVVEDPDYPGGCSIDTQVLEGSCALHRRGGRGCAIHAYTLDRGLDYHLLKPIYCCLFPVSVIERDLMPSPELDEGTMVCAGPGATLYRGARGELAHYFGDELIAELDALERAELARAAGD